MLFNSLALTICAISASDVFHISICQYQLFPSAKENSCFNE